VILSDEEVLFPTIRDTGNSCTRPVQYRCHLDQQQPKCTGEKNVSLIHWITPTVDSVVRSPVLSTADTGGSRFEEFCLQSFVSRISPMKRLEDGGRDGDHRTTWLHSHVRVPLPLESNDSTVGIRLAQGGIDERFGIMFCGKASRQDSSVLQCKMY
jgi:hypothetical protein